MTVEKLTFLKVIDNEKYWHKSIGIGIGNVANNICYHTVGCNFWVALVTGYRGHLSENLISKCAN